MPDPVTQPMHGTRRSVTDEHLPDTTRPTPRHVRYAIRALFLDGHEVWQAGRRPRWLPLAGVGLLLTIIVQNLLGMRGQLALYVPLGVAIFGLVGALLVATRNRPQPPISPTAPSWEPAEDA